MHTLYELTLHPIHQGLERGYNAYNALFEHPLYTHSPQEVFMRHESGWMKLVPSKQLHASFWNYMPFRSAMNKLYREHYKRHAFHMHTVRYSYAYDI